jgi:subtilisin inhibitor-like
MAVRLGVAGAALALALPAPAALRSATELRITVWPRGEGHGSKSWTLRCNPVGGTLPNRLKACRKLDALRDPFAPVPRETFCTQIDGGPALAWVRGTLRGRRVYARFNRRDGCQIDRWNRVRILFPIAIAPPR